MKYNLSKIEMLYQPVYTIGYEDLSLDEFLNLLAQYNIQQLVDVRSETENIPYQAPQFSRQLLAQELKARGIRYRFAGDYLGWDFAAKVGNDGVIRDKGYTEVSLNTRYMQGIERLSDLAAQPVIAILGISQDPYSCHRHKFIARSLVERGYKVYHIILNSSGVAHLEEAFPELRQEFERKRHAFRSELQRYGIELFYHLTHVDNLASILKHGILCKNEVEQKELNYTRIDDPEIQELRGRRDCQGRIFYLHDFVPLFFTTRPPMLFRIAVDEKLPNQRDIIYIAIDPLVILKPESRFSDGNAASSRTKFYSSPEELSKLNREVIFADTWNDPDEKIKEERRRIKGAEVLIYYRISPIYFKRVYTADNRRKLRALEAVKQAGLDLEVELKPNFYFTIGD